MTVSRHQIRPRLLDARKKISIVESIKKSENDHDPPLRTNSCSATFGNADPQNSPEAHQSHIVKNVREIPIPNYIVVDSYERDYPCTFKRPPFYIRFREARFEFGEFAQYDLDNEDEDWLKDINNKRKILPPEKLETILFKLEVLDHKARERAGVLPSTSATRVPVLLELGSAVKALEQHSLRFYLLQTIYTYWKAKRERWQRPILRQLQAPPPSYDTNPNSVFRAFKPREEAYCIHPRKMRRRGKNVSSFEGLRLPVTSF